jgi:hypothetical protein
MDLFDNPVFCGLAVLFTILFLLNMRSFLKIVPSLWDCVVRWKGSLDLEDSIQLSRSRNWIAAILFIPLCMVVYSHGLYEPDIASGLQPPLRLAVVTGALACYLLLRAFLNWQLEMHNFRSKTFTAANRSFYNYAIILFFLLFLAGALLKAFSCDERLTRTALVWIMAISYLFYIIRRGQIFSSSCNPFTTFLYLCSLELLPTAALVLSARLL